MKYLIPLLMLAMPVVGMAQKGQDIDYSQTVAYLQTKLPATMQMDLKVKKGLLIVSTSKDGAPYREDQLYMVDVDYENISYNEEEGAVMVRCKKGFKCCDRRFMTKKVRDQYGRMKFYIAAAHQEGFINAMKHLSKLFQIPNYHNSQPFE